MKNSFFDPGRPAGRLSCWLLALLLAASVLHATPPATTTISDVIYRADGTPAAGTLLITWPAFTTADNKAVPAGSMSVTIGASGAVSLALVPNQDATPAGTYYKVVMKLNDGTTSEEFWVVPTLSPTTISAIRSQVVPQGVALQVVTRQYVDGQLATKAEEAATVHRTGNENVDGVKSFSSSPTVPTPTTGAAAANKAYVDAAAPNPNTYVLKSGDTMTGALTSPGLVSAKLNNVRYANQFGSVQAAINDLPSCAFGSHCGVVIIPQGVSWDPATTTRGVETVLWDYATDSRYPQLWMGNGGEFRLMGSGAAQAGNLILNNTALDGSRASSIVFRTGPSTALRNIWQLRSGNYGNATAGVNADDLVLASWQGATYTTGTISSITNGSASVVGSGTSWTSALAGGNFQINLQPTVGATVLSVQDATHLTLASNWAGTTAGPGENYTISGGSVGTQRTRLTLGQNGVYIFNPNTPGNFDPLALATANRAYVLAAPSGASTTMWVRLNTFQAAGQTGVEFRSSNSDSKRKFLFLDDASNELRTFAADGSTVLTQLTDAGSYRVNGKIGVGKSPSAYLDVQAADNANPLLVYRSGGSVITHSFGIDSGGNGAFAVNDGTGATQVNLSSTGSSTFSLGLTASTVNATSGFQVNGSALAFSHLSGAASSGQLPATLVYTGQTNTYSTGTQDFESAAVTRPFRRLALASFPASCTANREFLERSDPAMAGQVLYVCNSAGNGWDLVGDGGGGGGGAPGGSNAQVQYNNAGAFGGIPNGSAGQCLTSNGAGVAPSFQGCGTGGGSPYASGGATANVIPKSNGASQLMDSALVDNGTSLVTTLEHMTLGAGEDTTAGLGVYPAAGLTGTDQVGIALGPTYTPAATSSGSDLAIFGYTADSSFTMADHYALNIADLTLGTGAAVTNDYGIYVSGITAGSANNYSIFTAGGLVANEANSIAATPTDVLHLRNATAATGGAPVQYSPALRWTGHAWNTGGSADNAADIRAYVRPTSGNPPTFDWVLRKSINGGAFSDIFTVNDGSVATAAVFNATTGFRVNGGAASGNVLRGNGTSFVSATLACADVTNCPSLVASGAAGAGPSKAGAAGTAARSDHDHRSLHTLTWYFPGTPSTGISPMILAVPQGIVNGTILGMQVTVATTSASSSSFNLQRCTANCAGASPSFSNIYSSDNALSANTSEADFGATNLTTTLNAKDQFKANLVTVGAGLKDVTLTLTYKYDTTN